MADEVLEKLDVLIRLQAVALVASVESSKDKMVLLEKAGLRPAQIAEILGTSAHNVSVVLSSARKSKAKR